MGQRGLDEIGAHVCASMARPITREQPSGTVHKYSKPCPVRN
jgi:hypothetical protein